MTERYTPDSPWRSYANDSAELVKGDRFLGWIPEPPFIGICRNVGPQPKAKHRWWQVDRHLWDHYQATPRGQFIRPAFWCPLPKPPEGKVGKTKPHQQPEFGTWNRMHHDTAPPLDREYLAYVPELGVLRAHYASYGPGAMHVFMSEVFGLRAARRSINDGEASIEAWMPLPGPALPFDEVVSLRELWLNEDNGLHASIRGRVFGTSSHAKIEDERAFGPGGHRPSTAIFW